MASLNMQGMDKRELRKRMRAIREELGPDGRAAIDAEIARRVTALPAYLDADMLFTYLSVGAEVDTRAVIRDAWSRGKLVAVPRCIPGTRLMEWHRIDGFDGLEAGPFGIEEPPAETATEVKVRATGGAVKAVALVPGYSFDAEGYRLGYGGGFYDMFLPGFPGTSVGLCRTAQLSDAPLPRNATDVPVDMVVTDCGCVGKQAS